MLKTNNINCVFFSIVIFLIIGTYHLNSQNITKGGVLLSDETWSGEILITKFIEVRKGITLTIMPGTVIKFKHYRDYRGTGERIGLIVDGGTVKAIGTAKEQIWFTSDATKPINGDWYGISCSNTKESIFKYVIVEYAVLGISQFDSSVLVSHSIIRWSNSEGLYAERSSPTFEYNLLYQNGYHEIALEQYNHDVKIINNIFRTGRQAAICHQETSALVQGNYFSDYPLEVVSAVMESNIIVKKNKFTDVNMKFAIVYDKTATVNTSENDFGDGSVPIPKLDFPDSKKTELGYTPGDEKDQYPFIYAGEDETRKVIKRIGKGQGFGWTLVYANGYLWRFRIGDFYMEFWRINPKTEETMIWPAKQFMNPRGLTWDGEYFWVNDFSVLKIHKFTIEGDNLKIIGTFDIPDRELGGTNGLTCDGKYLYLRSRNGTKIYVLDKNIKIVREIKFKEPITGALVWTGNDFWIVGGCDRGIGHFTKEGKLIGQIYPVAEGTWAIAWDGQYLWTLQRTCENWWNDPRIFQIKVLNDSF